MVKSTEIHVLCTSGSDALLTLRSNGVNILECNAYIGKNGLGKKTEGDGKTPKGTFHILTAFGIKPDPGTALPYVKIGEETYCCADPEFYNLLIDIREHPHQCTGEHMSDYVPEYNYGFFIDYNKECIFGLGSAIFFHCKGGKTYTGGCVAIDETSMVSILKTIDADTVIVIE